MKYYEEYLGTCNNVRCLILIGCKGSGENMEKICIPSDASEQNIKMYDLFTTIKYVRLETNAHPDLVGISEDDNPIIVVAETKEFV